MNNARLAECAEKPLVIVVDDDAAVCDSLDALLSSTGFRVRTHASAPDFLAGEVPAAAGCVLLDVFLGDGPDGIAVLGEMRRRGAKVPVVVVTGHGDLPMAVRAMKAGAVDFVEKPYAAERLIAAIQAATRNGAPAAAAAARLTRLSRREGDVLRALLAGKSNKMIALDLGISPRTVEVHRAAVMEKLEVKSLAEVVRIAFAAGVIPGAAN